jgi:hypothetical protein
LPRGSPIRVVAAVSGWWQLWLWRRRLRRLPLRRI